MTLLDFVQLRIIKTHRKAQEFAEHLVDRWHNDQVPGRLQDALGLTPREYQAWATGGVSLLTIARWRKKGPPPLDPEKPWFKLSGRPPQERVGYLEEKVKSEKQKSRGMPRIGSAGRTNSKGRRSSRRRL